MPTSLFHAISRLGTVANDARSDAHLVAAFLRNADQEAFAELVRRHGPAVLGVCRRFLGPTPDAEDAFQATFLVLVRRARGTEWRASLGPWLYGVALRVARKARAVRARRLANEKQVPAMSDPATPPPEPDDASAIIDEELIALPAIYRQPLVLCEIQGVSRRDAARELGLTEGTLSSRLARGRKMLRDRLTRRGVVPVVAGLATAVPAPLATATARNAVNVLTRAVGAVPAGVLILTEGVVKTMIVKWKLAAVMVAACLGLTGFGAWQGSAQPPPATAARPTTPPSAVPAEKEQAPVAPKEPERRGGTELVATIFGDVGITRAEFADHLIRRYGKKELEQFVNKQIIARAFAQKGWALKPAEVEAALDEDCKALGMAREKFTSEVLPRYNKTLEEWTEDVITPRLMLARLCKVKVPEVTEAELRRAFDAKYGERLDCRVIFWAKDEGDAARTASKKIAETSADFDCYAGNQSNNYLKTSGGIVPPFSRTPRLEADAPGIAASKLKAGEVSPLVKLDNGFTIIKCVAVIPADKTKTFDMEKPMVLAEVVRARIDREIPKLFHEMKQQADPKYHLTFPDPAPDRKSQP